MPPLGGVGVSDMIDIALLHDVIREIKFELANFEIFITETDFRQKLSQLHKAKICWTESIFSCWSGNVLQIQI